MTTLNSLEYYIDIRELMARAALADLHAAEDKRLLDAINCAEWEQSDKCKGNVLRYWRGDWYYRYRYVLVFNELKRYANLADVRRHIHD